MNKTKMILEYITFKRNMKFMKRLKLLLKSKK